MKKLMLLISLLLVSCSSAPIEVEATNTRTGKVSIEVPSHLILRQLGSKLIQESMLGHMNSQSYYFRPGKKRLVIFFRDSFDSEIVGVDSYEKVCSLVFDTLHVVTFLAIWDASLF